jgi:DNA-binding GntR family transcriptional regulator
VDSEDALTAAGRLIEAEHKADAAERALTVKILSGEFDLKSALSILELARALERSTDRLAGFGHLLRAHVLADLSA